MPTIPQRTANKIDTATTGDLQVVLRGGSESESVSVTSIPSGNISSSTTQITVDVEGILSAIEVDTARDITGAEVNLFGVFWSDMDFAEPFNGAQVGDFVEINEIKVNY